MSTPTPERFDQLGLPAPLLSALEAVGYETPSPIQAACIPALMEGHDLLGEAQTGTGKTAAFALPLLANLDVNARQPQALVLTPTRELAIQVAEALQKYARNMPGFHVLPVYGGQSMVVQLRQLERGAHIIVGTPGRVMDHLERKSLNLDSMKTLVLDEADEMLRMGFIDDVEWILEHTPSTRQTALFSATMPEAIRRVAHRHLRDPKEVKIKAATTTVTSIRQRYWLVAGLNKLDALTRMLEVEDSLDAAIIFARTKTATVELAEKLEARGYAAAALNGDMQQAQRERTIEQLKSGRLDIVVATDVAARGIDVPRITHVINYDIPYDTEAYVHRIGRTGRAGRSGNAILFVSARERYMLRNIERATRSPIEPMTLPSEEAVTQRRVALFKQTVAEALTNEQFDFFEDVVRQIEREQNVETRDVAAALAYLAQRERPLVQEGQRVRHQRQDEREERQQRAPTPAPSSPYAARPPKSVAAPAPAPVAPATPGADPNDPWAEARAAKRARKEAEREAKAAIAALNPVSHYSPNTGNADRPERADRGDRFERRSAAPQEGNSRYRIAVGRDQGVMPKDIVGAIANEAGISSKLIGQINLFDEFSTVELPTDVGNEILSVLQNVRVKGKAMAMAPDTGELPPSAPRRRPPFSEDRRERSFRDDRNGDRGQNRDRGGFGERRERSFGDAPRPQRDRSFSSDRPTRSNDRVAPAWDDRGDRPARPQNRSSAPGKGFSGFGNKGPNRPNRNK